MEQADGQFFLTMELVEGRSLAEALPRGGLSLECLLKIAIPVAEAMAAAHHKGITHRDLKPASIMLGEGEQDGRVKVLDFGLAKLTGSDEGSPDGDWTVQPVTAVGSVVGSGLYMSPEQIVGGDVDSRSDVFSLGVVIYQRRSGSHPGAAAVAPEVADDASITDAPRASEASELVARGWAHLRSESCFELSHTGLAFAAATVIEPTYAAAYAGLALARVAQATARDVPLVEAFAEAKAAALRVWRSCVGPKLPTKARTLPAAPGKGRKKLWGRCVNGGVYGLGGVRLWNSDISCNSSPSGYRLGSRCT